MRLRKSGQSVKIHQGDRPAEFEAIYRQQSCKFNSTHQL